MVSFYDKRRRASQQAPTLPIVAKLQGAFDAIDDANLIKALKGHRHRGCQGYTVQSLWRSYLTIYILNLGSIRGLIRALESSPALCAVTGINPFAVPHESTYSRFVARLSKHNDLVQVAIHKAVDALRENIEDFGTVVAVDSSDVKGHTKQHKTESPADSDARWGAKKKNGKMYFWLGYKVHMVADADTELPIHVEVTPANASDTKNFIGPLERSGVKPDYVTADAGYDSKENFGYVANELRAIPVIDLNKRGSKKGGKTSHRTKAERALLDIRENPGIQRDSADWKAVYNKRTSVERLFSRMKECRRLSTPRHRGLDKTTLHCYLSTLSIIASAIASFISGESSIRTAV